MTVDRYKQKGLWGGGANDEADPTSGASPDLGGQSRHGMPGNQSDPDIIDPWDTKIDNRFAEKLGNGAPKPTERLIKGGIPNQSRVGGDGFRGADFSSEQAEFRLDD